jgi:outer membrane protein assembly factor BamB
LPILHRYFISREVSFLLGSLALCLLVACGGQKDDLDDTSKPLPLTKFNEKVAVDEAWTTKVGSGQGGLYHRLTLAHDEQSIFVAEVGGLVARYDLNGKLLWRSKFSKLAAGVGVGQGMAMVADVDGLVIAINADNGEELWRVDVESEVLAAPQVANDTVIVQAYDGRLIGLDKDSGDQRWVYSIDPPVLTLRGTATPVIDEGVVYTGFSNGKLTAIDINNGDLIWGKLIAIAKGQAELDRIIDVDAAPLLVDSTAYAASYNGYLFAFLKASGRPLWRFEISTYRELAEGFQNVYAVSQKGHVFAVNASNGELKWEQTAFINRQLSAPIVFAGFLLVADNEGYLHVMSQLDGSVIGRERIARDGVRAPMISINQTLYVYSDKGKLSALKLDNL